jgi:disulfide bond formation protein DsbB
MNRESLPAERVLLALGLASLALILGALGFQYLGHMPPCEMCHWQRWPYIAAAILGIFGALLARDQASMLAWVAIILILASGLIGAYQTGMQWHFLPGPTACTADHPYIIGSNAPPVVRCDALSPVLFGQTLAFYNALCAFLIAGLGVAWLRKRP